MKKRLHRLVGACVATGIVGIAAVSSSMAIAADQPKSAGTPPPGNPSVSAPAATQRYAQAGDADAASLAKRIEEGKKIAWDRSKGNCLACHALPGGELPGNIGPALPYKGITMKQRFPDRAKLRAQIYNSMANNPNTAMPPFGLNRILTEDELEKVTDYIWSL